MYIKPRIKSKTLWFNGLTTAAAVLGAAAGVVPPPWMPWLLAAQGLVNFGLRLVTVAPVR